VFDELFDPEGLRVAYITIAAHMRGYRCTRIHSHTHTHTHTHKTHTHTHTHTHNTHTHIRTHTTSIGFWILPRLSAAHVQELPTHHVRTKECRRLCQPDISRSVGRSVARSAGSLLRIRLAKLRWNKFARAHLGCQNDRPAEQKLRAIVKAALAVWYQYCNNVDSRRNS